MSPLPLTPAPVPARRSAWSRWTALGRFTGLVLVIALFSALAPEAFPTLTNFRTVATQTVIVAIAAMGATLVIISGGIDLSVGSVVALTTVVAALALQAGQPPVLAAALGLASAGLCGLLNGLIITRLRIVPFIATLGMMSLVRGAAKLLAKGETVRPPFSWLEDLMSKTPPRPWMLVSPGVWLMILVATATSIVLARTVFGRRVVAIGSSEATARLCGIPVERIKTLVYALAGALAGLGGLMQFSRLTLGDPTVAVGLELDVIAAVVIGGGSLSGGEGSVMGTLIGAFILQFLRNGCNQVGVDNYVQDMIIGGLIIAAVALDQARRRLSA